MYKSFRLEVPTPQYGGGCLGRFGRSTEGLSGWQYLSSVALSGVCAGKTGSVEHVPVASGGQATACQGGTWAGTSGRCSSNNEWKYSGLVTAAAQWLRAGQSAGEGGAGPSWCVCCNKQASQRKLQRINSLSTVDSSTEKTLLRGPVIRMMGSAPHPTHTFPHFDWTCWTGDRLFPLVPSSDFWPTGHGPLPTTTWRDVIVGATKSGSVLVPLP